MIKILDPGLYSSIQDKGREGYQVNNIFDWSLSKNSTRDFGTSGLRKRGYTPRINYFYNWW